MEHLLVTRRSDRFLETMEKNRVAEFGTRWWRNR